MNEHSRFVLFALNATADLGNDIAQSLGRPLARHEEREFEDGEHKAIPLDSVTNADVYVVQSLHAGPIESAADKLCRLLFFIGARMPRRGWSRRHLLSERLRAK
jgi:ribose-phosphate pyrophosphokinase